LYLFLELTAPWQLFFGQAFLHTSAKSISVRMDISDRRREYEQQKLKVNNNL